MDLLAADLLPMGSRNSEEGEVKLRSDSGALFSFGAVFIMLMSDSNSMLMIDLASKNILEAVFNCSGK